MDISEKNLEATIEAVLLAGGPDGYPGGAGTTGGVRPFNLYNLGGRQPQH